MHDSLLLLIDNVSNFCVISTF